MASQLGFEVTAPATIHFADGNATFTALLPQFGSEKGMIADPHWKAIEPYADALWKLGYGFSTVTIDSNSDADSIKEMLRDWGWSGAEPKPPWW